MTTRTTTSTRTRAVGYVRLSVEDRTGNGVSLEAQRAKIAAYAGLYDLDLIEVIEDAGQSGRTLDRPGLRRAMALLKRGAADGLLVAKLDRLTRSVRDLGELLDTTFKHAALLSVGEQLDTRTAGGRLVLNVLASVAQWERETIGERTAAALAHKKARGERVGAVPYGFTLAGDGKALVPVPAEQVVVTLAIGLRTVGTSLRAIAAALAEHGHLTRTGRPFLPSQIARMTAGNGPAHQPRRRAA